MTELSFLVDLLLNHKLQKATKDAVAERIKEVESKFAPIQFTHRPGVGPNTVGLVPNIQDQAASTQAALLRQAEFTNTVDLRGIQEPQPVAVVAQTQATAAAMASRNQAIAESMAGKVDKVTGRPRKF